ncbi:small ribosomal subunit protein mS39 [Nomia melanderi]|uniref:small ribosomal subunit protein mS39 n=1 Tax=Nomia melanderi TaxID=2448451 RepID=UPI0013043371|nr:protein PTCD3 homolog, mitochondrial [Nomia melanderi]XP_031842746.1 protein PTCD3 homolog, mitochondrial [Nomia melanderi]
MNHLKRIPYRYPCCWLQHSQLFSSTLNSEIQIPPRIERGPTDILHALERTVDKCATINRTTITNDFYLCPRTKSEFFTYSLAYESGRKTAHWIHKEHRDLFPKHLSVPPIEAYLPPVVYTDESQVSEEELLQAISKLKVSDALDIYKLLPNVSNTTKQALLELLCFSNADADMFTPYEYQKWFFLLSKNSQWSHFPVIEDLYKFLSSQEDSVTVAKAHNAMILGYAKWQKIEEAWLLYQKCIEDNIPLNVTTHNYVIRIHSELFQIVDYDSLLNILRRMNDKGITPNVRTLNAALYALSKLPDLEQAKTLAIHLLIEFKRLKVKLSLASYMHTIAIFTRERRSGYDAFKNIIESIPEEEMAIQDPDDGQFFVQAIGLAYKYLCYASGEKINNILLVGNNYKFQYCSQQENRYFFSYLMLLLSTCSIEEFFTIYHKVVPYYYLPEYKLCVEILSFIQLHTPKEVGEYLTTFWSELERLRLTNTDLGFIALETISRSISQLEQPLKRMWANAAIKMWKSIKHEKTVKNVPTSLIGHIVLLLLTNNNVDEVRNILTYTIKNLNSFMPTMTKDQAHELFVLCISNNYLTEALLILEYSVNVGFQQIADMAKLLYNNKGLAADEREKLMTIIGDDLAVSLYEMNLE